MNLTQASSMEVILGSGGNFDHLVWVNIIGNIRNLQLNAISFKFLTYPPLPEITPIGEACSDHIWHQEHTQYV